ncbi:MAG: UDP-N-acetylmuramoyl-L-alanyl-D-glutamate--2,6-diaminopimelate ligase [Solirubrobacterales bacterium]|nr:UDP-N-acetylmuramoyl-L-alanyl-D-glutamate--2,6-diaminopimelate ligase [Solirubrobacterales bacterium]MCB8970470.1 UDP-N-acetylmuramoyl-L-alanyl-D-glutamate--2,6-diaminopimelate ligase [Thermoleophilales bacterium]MCO5325631.1 UDP-N-acetylmuramoyl-L-alanyl-D-glutamate--2,6-diaminopimelate ligase [Solirubrobacterales bacterium]
MRLDQLLADLGLPARVRGDDSAEITDLAFDSSRVEPGTLFFCVRGMSADGHNFAPAALEGGAAALVVDHHLDLDVPQVLVEDTRRAMAPLAARFFGDPSRELRMIGITGTNGKTTTAFLARAILEAAGLPCGLLGTVKQVVGGVEEEVVRTTPEAIDLQRTFRRMLDGGDRACVMEVSSHALVLGRADAIAFDVAAFTNLTQDHLDFHSDMEDYYEAKRLLFLPLADGGLLPPGAATVNVDDGYGARLRDELLAAGSPPVSSFSAAGAEADLSAHSVTFDAGGTSFELRLAGVTEALPVRLGIPGHFNVENALAALGCARALDVAPDVAIAALAGAESVPGRMEPVDEGQDFGVLVDYAHTPDSLENVLRAARRLTDGRLICVYGCGGDRDAGKRPLMGAAGAELADVPVVTSDNPRSEDPEAIIAQMLEGIPAERRDEVVVDADRRRAIATALAAAEAGDLVVIAGKGHEQGQEFEGGRKEPFDDRDVAREELGRLRAAGGTPA